MRLSDEEKYKLGWVFAVRGHDFLRAALDIPWRVISSGIRGEEIPDPEGKIIRAWLRDRVEDEVADAESKRRTA